MNQLTNINRRALVVHAILHTRYHASTFHRVSTSISSSHVAVSVIPPPPSSSSLS